MDLLQQRILDLEKNLEALESSFFYYLQTQNGLADWFDTDDSEDLDSTLEYPALLDPEALLLPLDDDPLPDMNVLPPADGNSGLPHPA